MKQQTAVMQLINFILVERRQEDGSIKFHAHDDFGKFLQMEKEQISKAWDDGYYAYFYSKETGREFENGEEYYNETYMTNKNNNDK